VDAARAFALLYYAVAVAADSACRIKPRTRTGENKERFATSVAEVHTWSR
jgi:hypothetical protein